MFLQEQGSAVPSNAAYSTATARQTPDQCANYMSSSDISLQPQVSIPNGGEKIDEVLKLYNLRDNLLIHWHIFNSEFI